MVFSPGDLSDIQSYDGQGNFAERPNEQNLAAVNSPVRPVMRNTGLFSMQSLAAATGRALAGKYPVSRARPNEERAGAGRILGYAMPGEPVCGMHSATKASRTRRSIRGQRK